MKKHGCWCLTAAGANRSILVLVAVVFGLLTTAGEAGLAQSAFRLVGQVERAYNRAGSTKRFDFELFWDRDNWLVRIFADGSSNQLGHVEYGFEGTNQYTLAFVNGEPWAEASKKPGIWINGAVRPRDIPSDFDNFLHVYWLVFRACVLPEERRDRLPARLIYGTEGRLEERWELSAEYIRTTADPGYVERILVFNPGVVYVFGPTNELPLAPPYDRGYINAALTVHDWIRVGSRFFPRAFSWNVYAPRPAGISSNDLETISSCVGSVAAVEPLGGEMRMMPSPPSKAKMVVVDYRFEHAVGRKGVYYVSTNGFWDPLQPEFRAEVVRLREELIGAERPLTRRLTIIRIGFVLVFATGVAVFVYLYRKTQVNPQPKPPKGCG